VFLTTKLFVSILVFIATCFGRKGPNQTKYTKVKLLGEKGICTAEKWASGVVLGPLCFPFFFRLFHSPLFLLFSYIISIFILL